MKNILASFLLGAGMLMFACVTPAGATPVLSFTGSFSSAFASGNQTINASGANVVTTLSGIFLNSLAVQGAGAANGLYTLGNTTETLDPASKTVTVAGSVMSCNAAFGGSCSLMNVGSALTTLFAFSLPGTPSVTGVTSSGSGGALSFNNATSLSSVNSSFLADLGFLTPPVGIVMASDGLTTAPTSTKKGRIFYATSNMLSITFAPEPDTFLLMGTALLAFGLLARRIRRRPRSQSATPPAK
jgi:hypothetical protein